MQNIKSFIIFVLLCLVIIGSGCASSNMEVVKVLPNGTEIKYKVGMSTAFQDFKGSNISVSLDPNGVTTVEAGAINNVTNEAVIAALDKLSKILEALLPLIASVPAVP